MSTFQNVLVGVDREPGAAHMILERARQLAEPSDIEAVHSCDHSRHYRKDYPVGLFGGSDAVDQAARDEAGEFLDAVCAPLGIHRRRVLDGRPARAMRTYAQQHKDLIVVGSHGHRLLRSFLGSTSNELVHGTPCDVLAVHLPRRGELASTKPYEHVLLAVDLSEESSQVAEHAKRIARERGIRMSVCHASHHLRRAARAQDKWRLDELTDQLGVGQENTFLRLGSTSHEVHRLADELDADLVVIGTHGKRGWELVTGSTGNAVLHGARCDTLMVRLD